MTDVAIPSSTGDGIPEFKRPLVDVVEVPVGSSTRFLVEIKSSSELRVCSLIILISDFKDLLL
jgi:hypothetical protein